jgi:UV DNA damage endonuclease
MNGEKVSALGYACINNTLSGEKVSVNNGMVRRTFEAKGLEYAGELAEKNLTSLLRVTEWNEQKGIKLYRLSSDMFPWMSEYEFDELPNYKNIAALLYQIGELIKRYGHTLESHPGPFTVLASDKPEVVRKSLKELEQHSQVFDLMQLPANQHFSVNIHVGSTRGNQKQLALDTWIENFRLLSHNTQKRVTLENDDKAAMYTIQDLYRVHEATGIALVFDSLHYQCHQDGFGYEETFKLAYSTWQEGFIPLVHHSSSKKLYEDENPEHQDWKINIAKQRKSKAVITKASSMRDHADFLYEKFESFGLPVRIMVECKEKEICLLKYQEQFGLY